MRCKFVFLTLIAWVTMISVPLLAVRHSKGTNASADGAVYVDVVDNDETPPTDTDTGTWGFSGNSNYQNNGIWYFSSSGLTGAFAAFAEVGDATSSAIGNSAAKTAPWGAYVETWVTSSDTYVELDNADSDEEAKYDGSGHSSAVFTADQDGQSTQALWTKFNSPYENLTFRKTGTLKAAGGLWPPPNGNGGGNPPTFWIQANYDLVKKHWDVNHSESQFNFSSDYNNQHWVRSVQSDDDEPYYMECSIAVSGQLDGPGSPPAISRLAEPWCSAGTSIW